VWLKDCVRAEVEGSDIDSSMASPVVGSTRTSIVSIRASPILWPRESLDGSPNLRPREIAVRCGHAKLPPPNLRPPAAEAFTAWAGAAVSTGEDPLQGNSSAVQRQLPTLISWRDSITGAVVSTGDHPVESHQVGEESVPDAVAGLMPSPLGSGVLADAEPEDSIPELQQAENAAEILFSHANSTKSAHVQEAMRCLSAAHKALGNNLHDNNAEITDLHARLDRTSQLRVDDLEKQRKFHEAETATLLNQLAAQQNILEGCGGKCVLCLDGSTSHASVPCGHLAFCGVCAAERPSPICPVCRQPSQCIIRIFKP